MQVDVSDSSIHTLTVALRSRAHGMAQDDCFSDAFKLTPHRPREIGAADMVKLGGA